MSMAMLLEHSQVEAAIHIQDFACAEWQKVLRDRRNRFANILGRSPTINWTQALGNQCIVFLFNCLGHVGGNNPGSNLVNLYSMLRETGSKQRGQHGKSGLGDAVFAAVD